MREELRKNLTGIKTEIMMCKTKMNDLISAKKETNETLSALKRKIIIQIADEVDANGKPAHSNQTKRDAEFAERIVKNTEYNNLLADIEKIENQIVELQMAIENLHYDFRIEEIVSRYTE
jgi:hypothetical protein